MIKIDIISGFLGAGKTTLIKKFITEAYKDEKLVLIENEFGEIGVDGGFLQDAGIEIREMNSGCICCSIVGDFEKSLKEVIELYAPERIIIEPTGVGKLSDVAKAVKDIDTEVSISLHNKIVVVNALKCEMYIKNFGEFFVNQVEHADAIVLSRTGNMKEEKLQKAIASLHGFNEKATMITTPWEQLDGAVMLDTIEKQNKLEESLLEELHQKHHDNHEHHHREGCGCGGHHDHHEHHHREGCGCGGHHDHHEHHHGEGCGCGGHHDHHHGEGCGCGGHHDHHGHHHVDDIFTSWGLETANKYQYDTFSQLLEDLENESKYGMILRAKGMLECEDRKWVYFDYVPGEVEVREGIPCPTGKICVIGAEIKEENLKQLFRV
ncbi:MAG: CobW family GTP-binding protein [Eubacteriales bacterium]